MDTARVTRSFGHGNFEITVEAICLFTNSHDIVSIRVGYRGDIPSWMDWLDWDELCRDIASDLTRQLSHSVSSEDVRRALSSYLGTAAIGLIG